MSSSQSVHPLQSVEAYRDFRRQLDGKIAEAWAQYQAKMQCRAGCFACCRPDFRISLVEAYEIREAISTLPESQLAAIHANLREEAPAYCPLLVDGQCSVYENRPVICRIFGFPVSDGETMATCELNFTEEREALFTAKCFNTQALSEITQLLSRLYLEEMGEALPDEAKPPMATIGEILTMAFRFESGGSPAV
jgi:Fe-S-cluster containining protein